MAKATTQFSWIAVNKSGEVCLDSDLPPLPRGWERCLDLKSGLMYLKEMDTTATPPPTHTSDKTPSSKMGLGGTNYDKREINGKKRQKLLPSDDGDEGGDPRLQLTLSLPSVGDHHHHQAARLTQNTHLATGRKSPQRALSLCNWQLGSSSAAVEMPKDNTTTHDAASSNCSSSASSLSDVVRAPNAQEVESPRFKEANCSGLKAKCSGLAEIAKERGLTVAAGCPQCLMYVLLSKNNPKCPKCGSSILLDLSPPTQGSIFDNRSHKC